MVTVVAEEMATVYIHSFSLSKLLCILISHPGALSMPTI